jgi:uncharacterized membrane protein YkvA (DUF1232 family)
MFGKKRHRHEARGILRETLLLLPNLVRLLLRLLKDARVPTTEKALLLGTITYVITPLDFIPDVLPFIGQVDDIYLVSLVLLRLLSRTENEVLDEHWDGPGRLGVTVDRISTAARYVLPKRVRNILIGRAVVAPKVAGGLLVSPGVESDDPPAVERHA